MTERRAIFASDLHLSADEPEKIDLFAAFVGRAAIEDASLYLLGDVFEIWLGDDDDTHPHPLVLATLRRFVQAGGELFVMRGNRDFLFGDKFCADTGARLLEDWHTIDVNGSRTLLTHGDLLCTRDIKYQQFRNYVRNPENQREFLSHPLAARREIAANTRTGTKASMLEKEDDIMDVEQSTVEKFMREFDAARLIHGHTHRPGDHRFTDDSGEQRERHVLGDWYGERCSVLVAHGGGLDRVSAATYADGAAALS